MIEAGRDGSLEARGQRLASEADDALRAEISALRREMDTIRGSLKDFGSEAYDTVKEKATDAAQYVQEEATSVAGVIREHPATAGTVLTVVGGLFFALGYLVGSSSFEQKQAWYRRYYS